MNDQVHLLSQLRLPSRYETLSNAVGEEVARILVAPEAATVSMFREAASHVVARGRGFLLPVHGASGTGKTTLISNIATWLPTSYETSVRFAGDEITVAALTAAVSEQLASEHSSADDQRVILCNVDDREGRPPTDSELAALKAFSRQVGAGSRTLVVWPETSIGRSQEMSTAYAAINGAPPISIPAQVQGPPASTWPDVAISTLRLVNRMAKLEEAGVNPHDYDPSRYRTLGAFLEEISADFVKNLQKLLASTEKPVRLIVAYASESTAHGVLSDISGSSHFGLLDTDKLLNATPDSAIGRWWGQRRGLLTTTIVRLDARVCCVAPTLSVAVLTRYGPSDVQDALATMGVSKKEPSEIATYLDRADLGKLLKHTAAPSAENRGNPGTNAVAAYSLLAKEKGLTQGRDKPLNAAFRDALSPTSPSATARAESKLSFGPLLPDVSLEEEALATCIEFAWRSGEYLVQTHRSDVAQYALVKLKNYAVTLGWTSD